MADTPQVNVGQPTELIITESTVVEILEIAKQGVPGGVGPQGPPGDAVVTPVGATPISGHSAVALDPEGELTPADCTEATHAGAVMGVVNRSYPAGSDAVVVNNGVVEHSGWTWTVGPVFVGSLGALTQTLPISAKFSQAIGHAVSPTRVLVDLQPPITIA